MAVESSHQAAHQRFGAHHRDTSTKFTERNKVQPQPSSTAQSFASNQTNNMPQIEQKIEEDGKNDNQILTDLDMIIHNLEKQQRENRNMQHKFSSNKGFVTTEVAENTGGMTSTGGFPGGGAVAAEPGEQYEQAITESLNLQN